MENKFDKKILILWILLIGFICSRLCDLYIAGLRRKNALQETVAAVDIASGINRSTQAGGEFYILLRELTELDAEIRRGKEPAESFDSAQIAQGELGLWTEKVAKIVEAISAKIDASDAKKLSSSQDEWKKIRDRDAEEAAAAESQLESKERKYLRFQSDATRNRAYELLKNYKEVLEN